MTGEGNKVAVLCKRPKNTAMYDVVLDRLPESSDGKADDRIEAVSDDIFSRIHPSAREALSAAGINDMEGLLTFLEGKDSTMTALCSIKDIGKATAKRIIKDLGL